jgi:AcrR family transcriptional regulator
VKPATPTEADVQAAADAILAESRKGTIRPTVSALAQRAGISRPTLYRNYPGLIERFLAGAAAIIQAAKSSKPAPLREFHDRISKLRHENEELRLHLDLYEEHIRRLTIENAKLTDELANAGTVTNLAVRRDRQHRDASS